MPVTTQIKIDDHGAMQRLSSFPSLQKTAMARALTRTAAWAKTRTLDAITGEGGLAIKRSDLDGKHSFGGVTATKATSERLEGRVNVSGHRIPLFRFSGRPTSSPTMHGVSYTIGEGTGRKTIEHNAFFARMKTGHVGFFRRLSRVDLEGKRMRFRQAGRT